MLNTKAKPVTGGAKKLQPKWDQLTDACLTKADFYDELLFPREGFLIEAGVGYPNEIAMVSSMNQLHKALKKKGTEEWKISRQADGSRVVRLVSMEKKAEKEEGSSTARKGNNNKIAPTIETRTKFESKLTKSKNLPATRTSAHEPSLGKITSSQTNENIPRIQATVHKKRPHRHKKDLHRSESLPHLAAHWEKREIMSKEEAEKHCQDCGDFEPYTIEELEKMAEEKRRFLELKEQNEKRSEDGVVEIFKRSNSVGDGYDSDLSTGSFRTVIIQRSKLKKNQSRISSTEEVFITDDDVMKRPTCTGKAGDDNGDQITGYELWRELEKNVVFDINENGIVSSIDCTEEINNEENNKVDGGVDNVVCKVENVMMAKPWKMGKQVWASMINRSTSKRTDVGILDREQWNRDVSNYENVTNVRLLKEGYCLKTQNETCDRLSIPKHGRYAIKNENFINKKSTQEQEIQRIPSNINNKSVMNKRVNVANNRKTLQVTENSKPTEQTKVPDENQVLKTKPGELTSSRSGLKNKSSGNIPAMEKKVKTTMSTLDICERAPSYRSFNSVVPLLPCDVRQLGCGDVSSTSSKKPSRPEFNIRTLQGLNDRPKLFSSIRNLEVRKHNTRVMPPMAECSIVSSSAVNRRKVMRSIDNENRRITARLNCIKSGPRPVHKITLSVRKTRREQLPFARIQNRALTK